MKLKEILKTAWENKGTIMEGFYNAYVSANDQVKKEAMARLEICRSNTCGLYNPKGENNDTVKAVFPGKESCGGCGCDLYAKAHAMSAHCYLKDKKAETIRSLFLAGMLTNISLTEEEVLVITSADTDKIIEIIQELRRHDVPIPDVGPDPLWEAVMTHEQEMEINKIAYKKQFENRKNNG